MEAGEVIARLGLAPHSEGGWYRETWRGPPGPEGRATGTAIFYLLEAGQVSRWHRVDAVEIWHWHAGAPLDLTLSPDGTSTEPRRLGPDLAQGEQPQVIVPAGAWQSARTGASWSLVGCTVTPGFRFDGFEMAPPGWEPGPC